MQAGRFALAALVILCAAAGRAAAGEIVLASPAPYWQVGVRDDELSHACSLDVFAPLRPGAVMARFSGPDGPALLDIAKSNGANLRDPTHLAKTGEDYFFRNAATTSCEVLVDRRAGG